MNRIQSFRGVFHARARHASRLLAAASICQMLASAVAAYDVKGVALGGGMLDAYLALRDRYGDQVEVSRGRHAESDTIDITASASYCGTEPRGRCEQIIVSSVLPLYRQTVIRIELVQTFFSKPTEQELVALLREKYGRAAIDETSPHRRRWSREMVWSTRTSVTAVPCNEPVCYARHPGQRYVAVYFDVAPDGRVRDLKLVSEDSASLQRNLDMQSRGDERLLAARKRAERSF